jgi:hypothetical protein
MCVGIYVLVATCIGVGLFYMVNRKGAVGYVPTVSLGANVALHLVVYAVLFALIVVFPVTWKYVREMDKTWEINVAAQTQLCTAT